MNTLQLVKEPSNNNTSKQHRPLTAIASLSLSSKTNTSANNQRVRRLLELLGSAVLLPWPAGSKGGKRKWKDRRLVDMNDPTYLAELETSGNIGVALGKRSNRLVTINIDYDHYVDVFLQANPSLAETLRTRGSRGCVIWLRFNDKYPATGKLRNLSGIRVGAWRADGKQTIIAGTHRSGMQYQFAVEKPVITINYRTIIWPKDIQPPNAIRSKKVGTEEKVAVCISDDSRQIQTYSRRPNKAADQLLSPKEVAERWSCSTETVKHRTRDGLLHPIRFNSRMIRYSLSEIIEVEAGART